MLDNAIGGHPERRSALIAHELLRLNIDIAAVSEVLLDEDGSFNEHGAGYILYWSGKPKTESHLPGVGFMVKNSIVFKLCRQVIPIVLCPYTSHYTTSNKSFSLYISGMQADRMEKNILYRSTRLIQKVSPNDKVIIFEQQSTITYRAAAIQLKDNPDASLIQVLVPHRLCLNALEKRS
ncbi:hypothetical protein LOAG_09413 [Loa loa]|uniref:CN hydrolase domain-containing protein n=1 Tax=Loa loa TaxID=7209 RepID=A0A1I7VG65_LOALO|nr:hypothetical protein LOAG_09413 [Loa loa]EFO19082.1 hypothetical protein LOAG_09413 [Loa loa]